jgi:hypothetical protein
MPTACLIWAFAALVINEVCYDPPGADGGAEFVELWCTGPDTLDLAGVRLEFANGAGSPPSWEVRWTAPDGMVLAPGAPLLIVDRGWAGVPAAVEVALGLQNGPDALRLARGDQVLDLVGWGALEWPDLSEGPPAADASGVALARRPDGHDTDHNADDFRAADPTPGAANWLDFAVTVPEVLWWPPSSERAGQPVVAELVVLNGGLSPLTGAVVSLERGPERWSAALPSLPPDGAVSVLLEAEPRTPGMQAVTLNVAHAGGQLDLGQVGAFQVGVPPLRLAEVMAAPAQGGEWCELHNTDSLPRSLAGLSLRDEDGTWRALPDVVLAPGEAQLVAQDPEQLTRWIAALSDQGMGPRCAVREPVACASWPSLNNSAPSSRSFADRLYLGDQDGQVIDHVTIGAADGVAPAGRTLERGGDERWREATARAGATPGCPAPSLPLPAAGSLGLTPNPFDPAGDPGAVSLVFEVPSDGLGWELRVHDLWGQRVRDLGGDDLGPGRRELVWDGLDDAGAVVPEGGYVASLRWRTQAGGLVLAARRLVVVRREDG